MKWIVVVECKVFIVASSERYVCSLTSCIPGTLLKDGREIF